MGIEDENEVIPPVCSLPFNTQLVLTSSQWITIHVRHHDFAAWCGNVPVQDCFAPLPVIARRVQEVKDELLERKGIKVDHVIMTSDERNATWWQDVADQGWLQIDHSKTVELYGEWSGLHPEAQFAVLLTSPNYQVPYFHRCRYPIERYRFRG